MKAIVIFWTLVVGFTQPCASAQQATPIAYGQTVVGSLETVDEQDTYQFTAQANDRVIVAAVDLNQSSGSFFPAVTLYDAKGTALGRPDNFLTATLPTAGTYTLVVSAEDQEGTGRYELTLQRTDNPVGVRALTFNQTLSNTLKTPTAMEAYRFTLPSRSRVLVTVKPRTDASERFEPSLFLFHNAADQPLAKSSSGFLRTALEAGTYTLLVMNDFSSGTGTYEVTLRQVGDLGRGTPLKFGQTVTGTLKEAGEVQVYQFAAEANDTIYVSYAELRPTSEDFAISLHLYDGAGTQLDEDSFSPLTATLPATGTYTLLVVEQFQDATGTYEFTLQRPNNPVGAVSLPFGQTIAGNLETPTAIDVYRFTAQASDRVLLTLSRLGDPAGLFPEARLYDAGGKKLAGPFFVGQLLATLPTTGTYTLLVADSFITSAGTYEVTLRRLNDRGVVKDLTFGQTVTGTLKTPTASDIYRFTAQANDRVSVAVAKLTGSGFFFPTATLYDAGGKKLVDPFSSLTLTSSSFATTTTLPATGSYTLVVSNVGGDTGTYELTLIRFDPTAATDLVFGQTIAGTIAKTTEEDVFRFLGNAGDTIALGVAVLTQPSGSLNLRVQLIKPDGTELRESSYGLLTATLPTAGAYLLYVSSLGPKAGTGTYELTLQRLNNPIGAKELAYDTIVEGVLDVASGSHVYRLIADANETFTACSTVKAHTSGSLDLTLELYDTSGKRLVDSPAGLKYTAPRSGTFYLFVADPSRDGTGIYRLTLRHGAVNCAGVDLAPPAVSLTQPRGGESLQSGAIFLITWTSSDDIGVVAQEIRLSTDSGQTFPTVIASGLNPTDRSYVWQVPATLKTAHGRIRVNASDAQSNVGFDESRSDVGILDMALPRDAATIQYEYDRLNRLKRILLPHERSMTYQYDAEGNRLQTLVGPSN